MRETLFSKEYAIYWPDQYEPLVNFLKKPPVGQPDNRGGFFDNNMEVIVFAAAYGFRQGHSLPGGNYSKEISTSIFENNGYGAFLYLIPLMSCKGSPDLYMLRDSDGEQRCLRIFESFVAGGLQLLNEDWTMAATKSAYMFVDDLLLKSSNKVSENNNSGIDGRVDDIF